MNAPTKRPRAHGYAKYKLDGCRCDVCRKACSDYTRYRTRQNAYGRPAFVDAEPVRTHVRALQAVGMGWRRIADEAGVGRSVMKKLLFGCPSRGMGPSKRIRPDTAEKLLAVRVTLADHAVIDGTGTRRRLQGLVAIGWSQAKLAAELGMSPSNLGRVIAAEHVLVSTARAMQRLYDRLWSTAPPEETHRDQITASRARRHALRHRWPVPMAWDDDTIDDPAARPSGAFRGAA
ncbi:hypothetical protein OU415_02460 [Saccharopolyspora sp. WRP15-2]|uniref:Helix-turn-helix domain-containing protein n=1 Tax=Saccharopolyspora oryzae TaxID=2997343 RepID=A0ABT4URD0_9PSEU|nr:hypothetical protein [Saccharopolyspora oryzae]MDA3624280.1 hypothetical protein [Saccharopolyspora oryzae]